MAPDAATLITGAVAAIGSSVGTVALVPKLLKGELVFKREFDALAKTHAAAMQQQKQGYEAVLAVKDDQIHELRATIQDLSSELKEQYREQAAGAKELLGAIEFVKSLASARIERRAGD